MFVTILFMIQSNLPYPPPTSKADVLPLGHIQTRPGDAGDRTTPRFARHKRHVRAVLAEGGYPVLQRP